MSVLALAATGSTNEIESGCTGLHVNGELWLFDVHSIEDVNQVIETCCKCGQSTGIIETTAVDFSGQVCVRISTGKLQHWAPTHPGGGHGVLQYLQRKTITSVSQTPDSPPSRRPHQSLGIPAEGDTICG